MPLAVEVGLGPGDFVLDGDPFPQKGGTTPNFRPMSVYCGERLPISAIAELLFSMLVTETKVANENTNKSLP